MANITYSKTDTGYISSKGHTISKQLCGKQVVWFVSLNDMPYTHKPTLHEAKQFIETMEGNK